VKGAVLDLFAGAGGWDVALERLGFEGHGIELDPHAVATRAARGFVTVHDDVTTYLGKEGAPPVPYVGLVASPPCTDWSDAGKRRKLDGKTGDLVLSLLPFVRALAPSWLAFEQVPSVIDVWETLACELSQQLGYLTWRGVLSSEEYGVPQVRKRAILIASRGGRVGPPAPSHRPHDALGTRLGGQRLPPPVTMAAALGWTHPGWWQERPATTVVSEFRPHVITAPGHRKRDAHDFVTRQHAGAEVTVPEAAILQGFAADYPWQGPPTSVRRQIGNAIPPPLAEAIVRTASGLVG
jgi:DNA (cytosine-5)-methyltransferase 1